MQVHISVGDTIAKMRRDFADLEEGKFRAAIARALNRTATTVRKEAGQAIRETYKVAARDLRKAISLRKASGQGDRLFADVRAEGKPLPVRAFGARQTRKGVSFQVKTASGRVSVPGAFIATMKSGHTAVFVRTATKGRAYVGGKLDGRRKRLTSKGNDTPIGELFTVSVPKSFSNKAIVKVMTAKTRERFPPTLAAELRFRSGQA